MDNICNIGLELSQRAQKPWIADAVLKKLSVHFGVSEDKIKEVIKFLIDSGIGKGDLPIDFYAKEQIVDCDIFFKQKRPIDNPEYYAFLERVQKKDKKTADELIADAKRDQITHVIFLQLYPLQSRRKITIQAEIFTELLKQSPEYLSHERMMREIFHLEEEAKKFLNEQKNKNKK